MSVPTNQPEFTETNQTWNLGLLYQDLAIAKQQLAPYKRKGLTPTEKLHLRGLLHGYSPARIAEQLCKSSRGVEADLSETLYRYIEKLTARSPNTLKNWRDVVDWLEAAGYKVAQQPQLSTPESQFIIGPPILHPRHFFGRDREIKRLFGLLNHIPLQNAAIIGPRRSGKTSLLHYLKGITTTLTTELRPQQRNDWLAMPEQYRWVFVDFQDPRLSTQQGLLSHILSHLSLPIPVPCELEQFMEVVVKHLHQPTVILLDEIGTALSRYPELNDAFWEGLRSLATNQLQGQLAFILASHKSPVQLAEHQGHSSPFFNIFGYTAHLGPLTQSEALSLIESAPMPFPEADVEWILAQSGCWALLLQILCRERAITLEEDPDDREWQQEGLRQIQPFRYLLQSS